MSSINSNTSRSVGFIDTVDGRNPAPADVVDSQAFIGFFYTSQVVQDFIHQAYGTDLVHHARRYTFGRWILGDSQGGNQFHLKVLRIMKVDSGEI